MARFYGVRRSASRTPAKLELDAALLLEGRNVNCAACLIGLIALRIA